MVVVVVVVASDVDSRAFSFPLEAELESFFTVFCC